MSASELEAIRRVEFPLTSSVAYLNHASYGPLPSRAINAQQRVNEAMARGALGDPIGVASEKCEAARTVIARLLNCTADDIAFLKGTSEGLNLVAQGLEWREGDEVVTYRLEHPHVVYPWVNLAERGVSVRYLEDRGSRFEADDVEALITDRTRVVCLSFVNFAHGFRAPLERIGEICRRRGVFFVVDAIQGLGALRLDAATLGADVISAHAYKFLLSGFSVAVCYVSPRVRAMRVPVPGWLGRARVLDTSTMLQYELAQTAAARRFESSIPHLGAVDGLRATVEMILDFGPERAEARVLELTAALAERFEERGFKVVSSRRDGERSGIISAIRGDLDTVALQRTLEREGVVCSVREGRIRVAPHFYNTLEEVDRLVACLPR